MKLYLAIDPHSKSILAICVGIKEATEIDRRLIRDREKNEEELEWAWIDIDSGQFLENDELKWNGENRWD